MQSPYQLLCQAHSQSCEPSSTTTWDISITFRLLPHLNALWWQTHWAEKISRLPIVTDLSNKHNFNYTHTKRCKIIRTPEVRCDSHLRNNNTKEPAWSDIIFRAIVNQISPRKSPTRILNFIKNRIHIGYYQKQNYNVSRYHNRCTLWWQFTKS